MPIVIKELFPSDPLSEALEKINFNFDQLILAGGGPQGPLGPIGVPGIPGPQGERGDHWQVGTTAPTADHGPNYGALKDFDFWISATGQVYYWSIGSTSWVNSGTNLTGPQGASGATGGSFEIGMYQGSTGNANTPLSIPPVGPTNYTPGSGGATTVASGGVDFIIPVNINKNSFFLGDGGWAYSKLNNFGVYDVTIPGNIQRLIPKQVIIQTAIDSTGLGGLTIGAYGATSAIGATQSNYEGVSTEVTDALNFFTAGFAYTNTAGQYSHQFRMRTGTINLEIQAGDNNFAALAAGKTPDLILRSNRTLIKDFTSNQITIGATSTMFREKAAIGYSSIPTFDSNSTLDNSGIMRSRGDIYVGALNGLANTIHIGYARTSDGSASLNLYTNGSTPTTSTFSIGRVNGVNGVATIDQTGTGALQINSTTSGSYINLVANHLSGHIRFSNSLGSEIARIDTVNSRVGIGTSSPSNTLDVVGSSMGLRAGIYGTSNSIEFINSIGSPISSRIAFGSDGSSWNLAFAKNVAGTYTDLMTLQTNGNFGIGTTTPNDRLEVKDGGIIVNTTTILNYSNGYGIQFNNNTSFYSGIKSYTSTPANNMGLSFFSSNAGSSVESMRIQPNGFISIGPSAHQNVPEYRIHIQGDEENSILIRSRNTTIGTQNNILLQRSNLSAATPNAYALGGLSFGGYNGTTWTSGYNGGSQILSYSSGTWTATSNPSDLRFSTTPINTIATVERMRISNSGNISVGSQGNATFNLEFQGNANKIIGVSGANTGDGFDLDVRGGQSGVTVDANGGILNLYMGQSRGSGNSSIGFWGLGIGGIASSNLRTYEQKAIMNENGNWAFGSITPSSSKIDLLGSLRIRSSSSNNNVLANGLRFNSDDDTYESEIRAYQGSSNSRLGLSFRTTDNSSTTSERMRLNPDGGIQMMNDTLVTEGSFTISVLTPTTIIDASYQNVINIASDDKDRIIYFSRDDDSGGGIIQGSMVMEVLIGVNTIYHAVLAYDFLSPAQGRKTAANASYSFVLPSGLSSIVRYKRIAFQTTGTLSYSAKSLRFGK